MNRLYICIFLLVFGVLAGVQAEDLETLKAQRADWPKKVTIVKAYSTDLFSIKGKKLGRQLVPKGRTFEIHGVYNEGVAVKLGSMVAFVPPDNTDIKEGIKNERLRKDLMMVKPRPGR